MDKERDTSQSHQAGEVGEKEPVAGETAPASGSAAAGLPESYEKALAEKKELYDRLLRKQAELDNFRKRTLKEKEDLRHHAAEDLIKSLLPTLDGFERALGHREKHVPEAYYQGLELIYRQLRDVLGRAGVTALETAGQIFDPHLHQAVEAVNAPGHRDHEIVEELQRGYKLRDKLLRPAIVKVAVEGSSAAGAAKHPSGKHAVNEEA